MTSALHAKTASPPPRGERRLVSALFLDVCGFTRISEQLDPELVTALLNRLFERVDAAVARYDGYLDKFIGDAALVLFGAPSAHEDDAERAVRAALDVLDELPDLEERLTKELGVRVPIQVHAAVGTGVVVAGVLGAGEAARYSALGDGVNVAARLLNQAGPGEIWVDLTTATRLRGRAVLESRGVVPLKGREEPVHCFRVLGLTATDESRGLGRRAPLIGRERALGALRQAAERLNVGVGGLVTVLGAAGVGKSRLLRDGLSDGFWSAHAGRCISYGRALPYHPWLDVVASLLADESLVEGLEHLDQHTPRATPRVSALGLFLGEEADDRLDAAARREAAVDALRDLLTVAARAKPTVVSLDDLHWADDASVELLDALLPIAAKAPLLFVIVRRPEGGEDAEAGLTQAAARLGVPHLGLELGPLSEPDTRRLVARLLDDDAVLPEVRLTRLIRRSGGVPLFVEEQLRHLQDEGALTWSGDGWVFDAGRADQSESTLPPTLHALLAARVDRLPPHLRARVELGAVFGEEFDPADIDACLGDDTDVWDALCAEGVLAPARAGRLVFARPMLQEVVYSTLLRPQRQALHAQAAERLARVSGARAQHALAWHLERAGQAAQAARVWAEAARSASHVGAPARRSSSSTAPCAPIHHGPPPWPCSARGSCCDRAASPRAESLDALLPSLRAEAPAVLLSRALSERALAAYLAGDGPEIVRFAEEALLLAEPTGDRLALAEALRRLGIGQEFCGEEALAQRTYRRCVTVVGDAEDRALIELAAGCTNDLGELERHAGRYEAALGWYERSLALWGEDPPAFMLLIQTMNAGAALVGLRRLPEAIVRLESVVVEAERAGARSVLPEALALLALALGAEGQPAEAAERAAAARDEAQRQGQHEGEAFACRVLGLLAATRGELEEAKRWLGESVDVFGAAGRAVEEQHSREALIAVTAGEAPPRGWLAWAQRAG
ncbi:MAG: AAA family ATPase [Deltaproteobacteria bacterium]|nr:AAA family ATPase [Deltaproteobacteria bacterium]